MGPPNACSVGKCIQFGRTPHTVCLLQRVAVDDECCEFHVQRMPDKPAIEAGGVLGGLLGGYVMILSGGNVASNEAFLSRCGCRWVSDFCRRFMVWKTEVGSQNLCVLSYCGVPGLMVRTLLDGGEEPSSEKHCSVTTCSLRLVSGVGGKRFRVRCLTLCWDSQHQKHSYWVANCQEIA